MKSRFEELHKKNKDYVGIEHGGWWTQVVNDILDTYDKLAPTKEYLVEDPFTKETRVAKRNTLIFSSLLILIVTYGLSSSGASIFGLGLAKKEQYILEGIFALVVGYQFVSFLLHYIRDLGRLFQTKVGLAHEPLVYPLYLIQTHLIQIERSKGSDDSNIEHMKNNTDKYADFIKKVSSSYFKVKALTTFNYLRFCLEFILWDFVIPASIALFALYLTKASAFQVIKDIVGKLL
jgi:hypothetical protein